MFTPTPTHIHTLATRIIDFTLSFVIKIVGGHIIYSASYLYAIY